ncbi:YkvA family protein [Paeniglutamicibacter sp. NPDC012692]|uniref:YkvA family protein n=1 Tax=Paeniglutamicibacter sp. NPDC012692 TaxID=3364388 RepID=UPI00369BB09E
MNWWDVLIAVVGGVVLVYAALLVLLALYAWRHPETVGFKDALRLLPDLLVLLRRLAADRSLPFGIRARLLLLLVYLASPIDLVPDFLPVIGYADDAIIVALVLRSVIRRAGDAPLGRHWPGTPAGLALVRRLAGTAPPPS